MDNTIEDVLANITAYYKEALTGEFNNVTCITPAQTFLAMQEWASLQTPSNDKWAAVIKEIESALDLFPEDETPYERGLYDGYINCKKLIEKSTPIPILTPCGWVKVEDGLPEVDGDCNVYSEDYDYVTTLFFDTKTESFVFMDADQNKHSCEYGDLVTHWMPLPTKPI